MEDPIKEKKKSTPWDDEIQFLKRGMIEEGPRYYTYRKKFVLSAALTINRAGDLGRALEEFVTMSIGRKKHQMMDNHTTVEYGKVVISFHDSDIYIGTGIRDF